jgi:hypothetical protein
MNQEIFNTFKLQDSDNQEADIGTVILSAKQDDRTQLLLVLKDQAITAKNLQLTKEYRLEYPSLAKYLH